MVSDPGWDERDLLGRFPREASPCKKLCAAPRSSVEVDADAGDAGRLETAAVRHRTLVSSMGQRDGQQA